MDIYNFLTNNYDLIMKLFLNIIDETGHEENYYIQILSGNVFCLINSENYKVVKHISYNKIKKIVIAYKINSLK